MQLTLFSIKLPVCPTFMTWHMEKITFEQAGTFLVFHSGRKAGRKLARGCSTSRFPWKQLALQRKDEILHIALCGKPWITGEPQYILFPIKPANYDCLAGLRQTVMCHFLLPCPASLFIYSPGTHHMYVGVRALRHGPSVCYLSGYGLIN